MKHYCAKRARAFCNVTSAWCIKPLVSILLLHKYSSPSQDSGPRQRCSIKQINRRKKACRTRQYPVATCATHCKTKRLEYSRFTNTALGLRLTIETLPCSVSRESSGTSSTPTFSAARSTSPELHIISFSRMTSLKKSARTSPSFFPTTSPFSTRAARHTPRPIISCTSSVLSTARGSMNYPFSYSKPSLSLVRRFSTSISLRILITTTLTNLRERVTSSAKCYLVFVRSL